MASSKGVKVWVGTRKGAYVAESDRGRRRWKVRPLGTLGPEAFHVVADPNDGGTVYAAMNDGWWGPTLMRSRDGGRRWAEVSVPGTPRMEKRKAPVRAPNPRFPIKNLWHIEPDRSGEPGSILMGVDPATLWRSSDRGDSWSAVRGINQHATRDQWNPGAGGLCLHTILLDPEEPRRMYAGISAAGLFRSDDGGKTWIPKNKGVVADFLPNKHPELGQCVHKVAMDAADPRKLYRQDHGGIYVSRNAGDSWIRVGKPLASDFGMVVATGPGTPGEAFFCPMEGRARLMTDGQFQVYRWSEEERDWSKLVARGAFPGGYGTHREGMAVDALDPAGLYVGTTTGQLFVSPDTGKHWSIVPMQFPAIHSVTVSV